MGTVEDTGEKKEEPETVEDTGEKKEEEKEEDLCGEDALKKKFDSLKAAGDWVICDWKLKHILSGNGIAGLKNALDPNRIQMACILIVGIDKQESVTSNRSKFCKFNWVGAKVKAKNKGRALEAKRKVASIYHGISMDLDITDIEDIQLKEIAKDLLRSGGAHVPNSYSSGDEDILVSDLKKSELKFSASKMNNRTPQNELLKFPIF